MMVSDKKCFFCGNTYSLDRHHCIHGTANRKKSEKYGLCVWLCKYHHTLATRSVHHDREMDKQLQQFAQRYFLENIGDMDLWMQEFKKNYLEEE